jgi:hypothetical protein
LWANGDALPEIVRALPAGLDPEGERMREKIFGPAGPVTAKLCVLAIWLSIRIKLELRCR